MSEPVPTAKLDLAAFDQRFRGPLMAFFKRRVGDHVEAEDLTQEVFIRIARADRPELKSADAYIFQIAANLVRDRMRMRSFRQSQSDANDRANETPLANRGRLLAMLAAVRSAAHCRSFDIPGRPEVLDQDLSSWIINCPLVASLQILLDPQLRSPRHDRPIATGRSAL